MVVSILQNAWSKVDRGNSGKTFFAATYLHLQSADSYQTWKL